jgi:integrase
VGIQRPWERIRARAGLVDVRRLLLLTGARRDEILSLRWRDVDLATGTLNLPDSKSGKKSIPSGRRPSSCWPQRRASRAAPT